MRFMVLPVDVLELPPWWQEIRHRLNDTMDDLKASILSHGFIHPVVVVKAPENRFLVIDGITRLLVAKEAGIRDIPAIVEEKESGNDLSAFKKAVLFNMAQSHLGIISKLKIVRFLVANGVSITDACKFIGRSEQWFRKYRLLLDLPKGIQDMVEGGEITVSEVLALKNLRGEYEPLPGSGLHSIKRSSGRRRRKEAPRCEICDEAVRSGDRKWIPVHPVCWDMLNDLLHEVLIFSREGNKIMFFCRGCGKMVGRADYSAGIWTIQRTLDSPGGGERDE